MKLEGTITDSTNNVSNVVLNVVGSNGYNDLYIGLILGAFVGLVFWVITTRYF